MVLWYQRSLLKLYLFGAQFRSMEVTSSLKFLGECYIIWSLQQPPGLVCPGEDYHIFNETKKVVFLKIIVCFMQYQCYLLCHCQSACFHVLDIPHSPRGPTSCLYFIHYELCTMLEWVSEWVSECVCVCVRVHVHVHSSEDHDLQAFLIVNQECVPSYKSVAGL